MSDAAAPSPANRTTTLHGMRLLLARLGWVLVALTFVFVLVVVAPRNPRLLLFNPLIEDSYQLVAELLEYRTYLSYIVFLRYLVAVFYFLVAAFIYWRRSDDWLAMLTSVALICLPYIILFGGVLYNLSEELNQAAWVNIVDGTLMVLGFLSIPLLLFLFPDGQIQPVRIKKLIKGLFLSLFLLVLIPQPYEPTGAEIWYAIPWWLAFTVFAALLLLGIIGQVYRYLRVSTPTQRQQTKVIVFAILASLGWLVFIALRASASSMRFEAASIYGMFELHASLLVAALIPTAMAISVLRYHLYDIDLIIRRTLIYGTLTFTLGAIYLVTIILLQGLVRSQSGQESSLVIVISTLAIAALFNPLRRRIQEFIDRRFFRQRYDTQAILDHFSARTRDMVNLEQIHGEMLQAVCKALQPGHTILWLQESSGENKSGKTDRQEGEE